MVRATRTIAAKPLARLGPRPHSGSRHPAGNSRLISQAGESCFCVGIAGGGSCAVPSNGFSNVLAHTAAICIHDAKLVHRRGDPHVIRCQPGAELPLIHAEPAKARTERGGAFASLPDANSAAVCLLSAVFTTCCQFLYSGIFGSLNAIASGAAFSTMKIGACRSEEHTSELQSRQYLVC